MNTKASNARLQVGHYIAAVPASLMLSMILACAAPEIDIPYSTLRKWSPNNAARGLGLEIVLEQEDVTEQDLINLIKQLSSGHDPVVIRVFKSKTAYEQEQTNDFGPEYKSDYY